MAERFIQIAVVYLVAGASLGLYMGIKENFVLMPVHGHILLAGWVSLALMGVIYRLYPAASVSRLARAHFWLHNLGLPAFMLGLALLLSGYGMTPFLPMGSAIVVLGFACFAVNAWKYIRS